MLLPAPPLYPRKRKPRPRTRQFGPPPVGMLTLVSASYVPGENVELTFSRAIDVAGIDPSAFAVTDGLIVGFNYVGIGATQAGPSSVRVDLSGTVETTDPVTTLSASGANGIVADGDGASWAGANELGLPFP